jgi:lipopolysaccharide transport system permease protein
LMVKYRDFRHILPFVTQFGLYISPVGFTTKIVPEKWKILYSLNPMVGIIDGFRWAILGESYRPDWFSLVTSTVIITVVLATGILHFRRTEKSFADVI